MEVSTVVIDNGAYQMRAGLGGEKEPTCVIPSIIGMPKTTQPNVKDYYVGADVFSQSSILKLFCPIENRVITNFEGMEKVWTHIITNQLKLEPETHPVLMTESPQNPKSCREKSLQIMMETLKVPAYYTTYPEVLSLYSAGLTTGIVVDSGETITHIVPVYECFSMNHVLSHLDIGGRHINEYLKKILMYNGIKLQTTKEREVLTDIKEKLCYVSVDPDSDLQKIEHVNEIETTFKMPDGTVIQISSQRFKAPEPLFDPSLLNNNQSPGLHQLINDTINRCDDLKPLMYSSILLSGGTMMFDGMKKRIKKSVSELAPKDTKVSVIDPPNRQEAAWIGGSVLVSLATFSQMWITKAEYEETGPSIVNLKCF
ncbi:hypothetical protein M9Y10_041511 [Tritrichomonas musculus]|uniref:Actin n=1 Tax=Tritrichomonas musculus TaxID=1915356 RepID=A0ABR2K549_9EUKA